jgi:hypothetical protein
MEIEKDRDPDLHPYHPYNCQCGVCIADQCYECGDFATNGRIFKKAVVDTDPGDPEVGPNPDVCTVSICEECWPKYEKYEAKED